MRKLILATLLSTSLYFVGAQCCAENNGNIVQTSLFSNVTSILKDRLPSNVAPENVVVVCDIDQTLGTNSADAFFYKKMDELGKKGIYGQSNVHMTYIDYTDYHYQNKFVLVEQNTPSIVRSLQAAGHKFFGLTSRSAHLALITERHLKGIGISFHSGEEYAVLLLEHPTDNPENKDFSACRNGIIHVGGNDKGETLMKFFEKMEIEPGFVLFIDDGERHVKSVVSALERKTIPCVGIVYDGAKVHPQTAAAAA